MGNNVASLVLNAAPSALADPPPGLTCRPGTIAEGQVVGAFTLAAAPNATFGPLVLNVVGEGRGSSGPIVIQASKVILFGPPTTDQALPEDWPSLSSLVSRYGAARAGLPPSVVLPWYLQFPGQPRRIAGQTGARMGEQYNSFLVQGDFARGDFAIEGLRPPDDVPLPRVRQRDGLRRPRLQVKEQVFRPVGRLDVEHGQPVDRTDPADAAERGDARGDGLEDGDQ